MMQFLFLFLFVCSNVFAAEFLLPAKTVHILDLGPKEYHQAIAKALKEAKGNVTEIARALDDIGPHQREAMAFLIAHMPVQDLRKLKSEFLIENVQLAHQALFEVPWANSIPKEVFFNDILPYAVINERRDNWRRDFYERFIQRAKQARSIPEALKVLNEEAFEELQVSYHPTKRPKPDQSPYESMKAHYASCTGLSVMLVDILRAVAIPARIAAIPLWADETGNHTWVEVWVNGTWHHIGAWEPTALDKTWFTEKAASTDANHRIYATSYSRTDMPFPMVWAPENQSVWGIDVTDNYTRRAWTKK
jgi:hypothetical protein